MHEKIDLTGAFGREAVVACVSGGLDSCILLALLAAEFTTVYPVFVRNGYRWEDAELQALQQFIQALPHRNLKPVQEITLPMTQILSTYWGQEGYNPGFDDGYRANFIPGRNIVILSNVLIYAYTCQAPNIAMGLLEGSPYPDAQPEFFQAFAIMAEQGMQFKPVVLTPFLQWKKETVIKVGQQLNLPLQLSLSCVNPQSGKHCGAHCNKCAERQKGFALAGVPDPTEYAFPPPVVDWKNHHWRD
jgi:7-cyano-7-deazaguanine synthase